ncbi:MAG TPA: TrkA family potassium uptake protein [Anaerolineales bacterium]|nr:TrkA family potassium uptake protein [Anaerolineales bacterium]HMV96081.1 TrkA family potassium uptake protein [Anaerolineales bacterium]HMX17762.1 TrkA family potassium uptake protein [Anaerolineales bacterium]HMX75085.1 TrkA family potassium uptake protein [Anaerolineales bacterium]HMZ43982.1 TrkA family potassium uptake protein [Anaerolineales bacterium]
MNLIVVGCGRVGAELAYRLFKGGHQVTIVDSNRQAFNRLHPDFRGRTLEGEGLAENVLDRAGIKEADGLAAVTNSDTLNAVVAHTARIYYHVPVVVARNYDPNLRPVIESFGLQTVSSTFWGAQRVEELLINPAQRVVYSAGNGEVEVYEVSIPESWNGRTLKELLDPLKNCFAVAVTRAGRSSLPDLGMVLQTGDMLNFSSTYDGIGALTSRLSGKAEA